MASITLSVERLVSSDDVIRSEGEGRSSERDGPADPVSGQEQTSLSEVGSDRGNGPEASPSVSQVTRAGAREVGRRLRLGGLAFAVTGLALALGSSIGFWTTVGLSIFYVLLPALGWAQLPALRGISLERIPVYAGSAATILGIGVTALALGALLDGGWARIGLQPLSLVSTLVWTGGTTLAGLFVMLAFEPLDRRVASPGSEIVAQLMPRTSRERQAFAGLSVAAGVGEEIGYRGYAMAAVGGLVPGAWAAAVASSIPFAILHAYQGPVGILRTGIVGVVLAAPVIVTGSLLPAVLAHTLIDLVAGLYLGPRLIRGARRAGVRRGQAPAGSGDI